jgi:hypothetical protein
MSDFLYPVFVMEDFMKNRILICATLSVLSISQVFSCDIHGKTGFAPENNRRISVWDKATNGMTEEKFNAIIARVSDLYAPIVKSKGGKLQMNNNWTDETVNAYAQRTGSTWSVNMFGGLARSPEITDDGFMGVVCHELGHHIGGAPKKGGWIGAWASNEGQADYFATLKCLRRVLENDDNFAITSKMKIDAEVTTKCEMIYKSASEIALCQRVSMAGKSLATLLSSLGGTGVVAFTTPDKSVVTKTNDAHPAAQCRLDTYFSGVLCDKAILDEVDNKDPIKGACVKSDGHEFGVRPLCWYKPSSKEI